MKLICIACLFILPVFAVLPPFAEAKREIKSILESPELAEFIPYGDVFEQITKIDEGYLITTNKREIKVIFNYIKNNRIGPAQYTFEFYQ